MYFYNLTNFNYQLININNDYFYFNDELFDDNLLNFLNSIKKKKINKLYNLNFKKKGKNIKLIII